MDILCHIHIEGAEYRLHAPYKFAALPRVGEVVELDFDNEQGSDYVVYEVHHSPDGLQKLPAFVVLHVRKVKS